MKFSFINLGCKINQIEMEQVAHGLVDLGYTYTPDVLESNFLIINTCTVTANADKKSLATIKKYSILENLQNVFVTGCYSELEPNLATKVHPKNRLIAQKDKSKIPEIIHGIFKEQYSFSDHKPLADNRFFAFKNARVAPGALQNEQISYFEHTRAFVKIQDGCNAFCSYCRIPFARGAPVSRSYSNIIEHVKRLKESGIKELVLSGINIGKYYDGGAAKTFSELLADILNQSNGMRVKISSIEPFSLDDSFFSLIAHPNLAPHIHLPLQGLSDNILERMNRRYRLKDFKNIVDRIYSIRPDFSIATDVIVGYVGESEEDFKFGLEFVKQCGFSKLHVFPFSSRPLTDDYLELNKNQSGGFATKININSGDEVDGKVKKERSKIMRTLSNELEVAFAKKITNTEQNLIIEKAISSPEPKSFKSNMRSYFQGTTEYNLKGILAVKECDDVEKGGEVPVLIDVISPLLFKKV